MTLMSIVVRLFLTVLPFHPETTVQSCRLIINMQKVAVYPPSTVSSDNGSTTTDFSLTSFIDVS